MAKSLPANAGDTGDAGSNSGSGRTPGEGNGNVLQYLCLENPMDRGGYSPWGCKELDTTEHARMQVWSQPSSCLSCSRVTCVSVGDWCRAFLW